MNSPAYLKNDLKAIKESVTNMPPEKGIVEVVDFLDAIIDYQTDLFETFAEIAADAEGEFISNDTAAIFASALGHSKVVIEIFSAMLHPEGALAEHIDDVTRQRGLAVAQAAAIEINKAERELADLMTEEEIEDGHDERHGDGDEDEGDSETESETEV